MFGKDDEKTFGCMVIAGIIAAIGVGIVIGAGLAMIVRGC